MMKSECPLVRRGRIWFLFDGEAGPFMGGAWVVHGAGVWSRAWWCFFNADPEFQIK